MLSPLSPLDSPSYLFAPELYTSALVQSDHTSTPSLAFLFNYGAYLVEPNFDPPSPSALLAPEVTGSLSLNLVLPVPVSLPLPMPVLPETTGLLPLPLVIPAPVLLPAPVVNLVNLTNPTANPQQNLPIPIAQPTFQMPLHGTPNAPKFSGKTPSRLP